MHSIPLPDNVDYVARMARHLQAEFPDITLETAESWLADMLGYSGAFELYLASDNTPLLNSSKFARNSLQPRETSAQFQAETLAAHASIPLDRAAALVDNLAEPTFDDATARDGMLWAEALRAHTAGELDRAIAVTIESFRRHADSPLADTGRLVISVALTTTPAHPRLAELLNTAADHGAPEHAYNWATYLCSTATTPAEIAIACTNFQRAIMHARSPRIRAASLLNYATVMRAGRLTGQPDLPFALELAEESARMGLVLGMIEATTICSAVANAGDTAFIEKAAYWAQFALDYVNDGRIVLDSNGEAQLSDILDRCRLGLAYIHVYGTFPGADEEVGMRLIEDLANAGNPQALAYREVGLKKRDARAPSG